MEIGEMTKRFFHEYLINRIRSYRLAKAKGDCDTIERVQHLNDILWGIIRGLTFPKEQIDAVVQELKTLIDLAGVDQVYLKMAIEALAQ